MRTTIEEKKQNTRRSNETIKRYQNQNPKLTRKVDEFEGIVNANPEKVFPLLCPTMEADWIAGWEAEIIYSKSGYAEYKCIFRNFIRSENGLVEDGLWMVTNYVKDKNICFCRFQENVLSYLEINLEKNNNGTTKTYWKYTMTALNEKGNQLIEKRSSNDGIIGLLNNYLESRN